MTPNIATERLGSSLFGTRRMSIGDPVDDRADSYRAEDDDDEHLMTRNQFLSVSLMPSICPNRASCFCPL